MCARATPICVNSQSDDLLTYLLLPAQSVRLVLLHIPGTILRSWNDIFMKMGGLLQGTVDLVLRVLAVILLFVRCTPRRISLRYS